MKKFFGIVILAAVAALFSLLGGCSPEQPEQSAPSFIKVENGQFIRDGKPYYFVGTNFWYGAILGSQGEGGNRERLHKELDMLKEMGVDNLRILVGGDGDNGVPSKIEPTLQTAPGLYNDDILDGLDYLLKEMAARNMTAVLYLNNSWEWSGGYTQYVAWAEGSKAPVPSVDGWNAYMEYAKEFVRNEGAKALFADHVRYIVGRTNRYTGVAYVDDPTIFSWQVGNEPRAFDDRNKAAFAKWIESVAKLIRELDPNHMISTGSEGFHGCQNDMELCKRIHSFAEIDYVNCHIWPYNWKWIDEQNMEKQLPTACHNTKRYIDDHVAVAEELNKPLVVEEFGFPRDGMLFERGSRTALRDKYYEHLFRLIERSAEADGKLAGCNFWGWGGLAKTNVEDHIYWQRGDDYTGDPAQEQQGLNSVFADDIHTIEVIKAANNALAEMGKR